MKHFASLFVVLAACTDATPAEGPPYVDDSELLGAGKADGSIALGTSRVRGQQSGYRSDATDFSCTQGGKVAFDVVYENKSLPWGVKLELWRGMSGEDWCGGCDPAYHNSFEWSYHKVDTLASSGAWQWRAQTTAYGYAAGAGGRFNSMKYVVRITMPDGTVRWDNGGSRWGYYEVTVPEPRCQASWTPWQTYDSAMQDLQVFTRYRY